MCANVKKESAIHDIFSGAWNLRNDPLLSQWKERLIQYLFIFDLVCIVGFLLVWKFNLAPTNYNNALYFISTMVQAQAAIVSLVISFTIIAIQMSASSYTPRVVDVMKKNPDFWYLLIIYVGAMSYGFFTLKIVADPDPYLVSSVLILGIFTFCSLFLYIKNTIHLLRPDVLVTMLVKEIDIKNESNDDSMQPVFDVIHNSIMRYDVTTTRTGLNTLLDHILDLLSNSNSRGREKLADNLTKSFCNFTKRSALVALRNDDEGILKEIISVLKKLGLELANYRLKYETDRVIDVLKVIGVQSAERDLKEVTEQVATTLGCIGLNVANKGLEKVTSNAVRALAEVGKHAADNKQDWAPYTVARQLQEIGLYAAKAREVKSKELSIKVSGSGYKEPIWTPDITISSVTDALKQVGITSANKGLDRTTRTVIKALKEISKYATEDKMHLDYKQLSEAQQIVAKCAEDNGLHL